MKKLNWETIFWNLKCACKKLERLHCHLHYLAFDELPEDWKGASSYKEILAKEEQRSPFSEYHLHLDLEYAYYHLNLAWNARHVPMERFPVGMNKMDTDWSKEPYEVLFKEMLGLEWAQRKMARKWGKFPRSRYFADLWPVNYHRRKRRFCGRYRKISLTPVRIGLYQAQRKLGILCYLVAKELGDRSRWSVRPKGLCEETGKKPLTERDFCHWMHRIYIQMNFAWNSRWDKTFATRKHALWRRLRFPPAFLPSGHLVCVHVPTDLFHAFRESGKVRKPPVRQGVR